MSGEYISIKEDVLKKIEERLPEMRELFGIETLGIFGSVARGEDTPDSDVDVLYLFSDDRGNLHEYIGLIDYLENLFQRKVDIVSIDYIDKYLKPHIKKDALLYGKNIGVW